MLTASTRAKFKDEPGALAAMRLLKAAGADVHTRTRESTPLHTATTRGWKDIMKELVSYGVDINAKDSDNLTGGESGSPALAQCPDPDHHRTGSE